MNQHPFFDGQHEPSNPNNPDAVDIDASTAFTGTEHVKFYWTKQGFLDHGKTLRYGEAVDLKTAIDCMYEGMRMSGHRRKRQDKGGREYVYLNFYQTNGTIDAKIILETGLESLLDDYHRGKINIKFTFADLYKEATNQE